MSSTIKIGTGEFPLASAPQISETSAIIKIVKSSTVTGDAVLAAINGADRFTVVTDGTAGAEQTGYKAPDSVTVGDTTITVIMAKLTGDQQTVKALQEDTSNIKTLLALFQLAVENKFSEGA